MVKVFLKSYTAAVYNDISGFFPADGKVAKSFNLDVGANSEAVYTCQIKC